MKSEKFIGKTGRFYCFFEFANSKWFGRKTPIWKRFLRKILKLLKIQVLLILRLSFKL